jgi:phosphoglucosamine mutase
MRIERLFGTDGIRDVANRGALTPVNAARLGQAIGRLLRHSPHGFTEPLGRRLSLLNHRVSLGKATPRVVLIGRDTRASGPMIEADRKSVV